ncbi:hypothetical protein ACFLZN_00200, partial [Nanoarchaeota archaeon]
AITLRDKRISNGWDPKARQNFHPDLRISPLEHQEFEELLELAGLGKDNATRDWIEVNTLPRSRRTD